MVEKMLFLSTSHVSRATATACESSGPEYRVPGIPLTLINPDYGWICWADNDIAGSPSEPPHADLAAVLAHALAQGCRWVRFDCDGDVIEGLPVYDWDAEPVPVAAPATRPTVAVPELEHDAMMLKRFDHKVGPVGRVERRVVAALCAHLAAYGWTPHDVYDNYDRTRVSTARGAMELIFNLDDAWLTFAKNERRHWVRLVMGNSGWDVISDWSYAPGNADGFEGAMEAFDAEEFA